LCTSVIERLRVFPSAEARGGAQLLLLLLLVLLLLVSEKVIIFSLRQQ
jgi:hypothetical protein